MNSIFTTARKIVRSVLSSISELGISRFGGLSTSARALADTLTLNLLQRLLLSAIGALTIAFGIVATIRSGLGVGPGDVLLTGLVNTFDIPLTYASWIFLGVLTLVLFTLRGRPTFGGLYTHFLVGASFPIAQLAIAEIPEATVVHRGVLFTVGFLGLCLGIEIAAVSGIGRTNPDLISERVNTLTGLDKRIFRSLFEFALIGVGVLLGGTLGVGTVVIALGIGPTLKFMNDFVTDAVAGRRLRLGQPETPVAASVPTTD